VAEISSPASATQRLPAAIRRSRLLDVVKRDGFVSVSRIAESLGVSEMTVRRDLEVLQKSGHVDRTFGGAVRREVYDAREPVFDRRRRNHAAAKRAIALSASELVASGETVGIDVGTTALALAGELSGRTDIRVFTNNLRAAMELSGGGSAVYVPGGQVRQSELSIVGAAAVAQLKTFFLDRVFIGVSGITETGLYDYSIEDTEVKRTFIERTERVVVLCDSSKFDRRSLALVAALDEIDVIVTDEAPPSHLRAALEAANVEIMVTGSVDAAEKEIV